MKINKKNPVKNKKPISKNQKKKSVVKSDLNNSSSKKSSKNSASDKKKRNKINLEHLKNNKVASTKTTLHQIKKNDNSNKYETHSKINTEKIQQLLKLKKKDNLNIPSSSEQLRERIVSQLRASRFRYLNDTLYNNESSESRKMFKEDPNAFKAYHEGYQYQLEQWSLNPLNTIIAAIKKMPKDYVIADFGCGEGRLADSVKQKVHSLDLVAINDKITACDMAHTPLLTNGINVVVFCLSLMGTNLHDYILEANRVLKIDGVLKIAEISSRFDDVNEFINALAFYGFKYTWKDLSHKYFYFMDFKKVKNVDIKCKNLPQLSLKPCLYKKR